LFQGKIVKKITNKKKVKTRISAYK